METTNKPSKSLEIKVPKLQNVTTYAISPSGGSTKSISHSTLSSPKPL
jgi:hypothetical protein